MLLPSILEPEGWRSLCFLKRRKTNTNNLQIGGSSVGFGRISVPPALRDDADLATPFLASAAQAFRDVVVCFTLFETLLSRRDKQHSPLQV